MKTLFDIDARSSIHRRIDRLEPNSVRQWGKMHAGQMVCHVGDQLRVGLGELETEGVPGFLRFKPLRQLFVYWLPWPKGRIEAPPEMLTTTPSEWNDDVSALHVLIENFGKGDPVAKWASHPDFGPLSGDEWGILSWKHLDYHLQQFGV
jgi:hypothetical protein